MHDIDGRTPLETRAKSINEQQAVFELAYYALDLVLDIAKFVRLRRVRWRDVIHHVACIAGACTLLGVQRHLTAGSVVAGLLFLQHGTTPLLNMSWLVRTLRARYRARADGTGGTACVVACLGRLEQVLQVLLAVGFSFLRVAFWPVVVLWYEQSRRRRTEGEGGEIAASGLGDGVTVAGGTLHADADAGATRWYCYAGAAGMAALNLSWMLSALKQRSGAKVQAGRPRGTD